MKDQSPKRSNGITLALLAGVLVGIGLLLWAYQPAPPPAGPSAETPAAERPQADAAPAPAPVPVAPQASESPLEKQWGIQVVSLSLTNRDTSVQVRYTVVAPEKTLLLAGTNTAAYLINEADGAKLPMITGPSEGDVPQGASARTTRRMMKQAGQFPPPPNRLIAGMTYSLQIPNWGQALQSGSKVSLVVGDFRQDGLTVE